MTTTKFNHAPAVQNIDAINIPNTRQWKTANDISVFELNKENCRLLRVDFVFFAGRPSESKKLAAACCANLLREGAGPYSSGEVAEKIDFCGASMSTRATLDTIEVSLTCLPEQLKPLTPILSSILSEAHLDKDELDQFISRQIERLKLQLVKNDIQAYRHITESVFGPDHPYGYNSTEELYQEIHFQDIREHYNRCLTGHRCRIFIAGGAEQEHRDIINNIAQVIPKGIPSRDSSVLRNASTERRRVFPGSPEQTSICMARPLFTREHEDYPGMVLLSTILGGFFGSRLVMNIRERLGLTYGIYSTLDIHVHDGLLMISTDVSNENINVCLKEIYTEFDKLIEYDVQLQELSLVRNYLMGTFISLFDGPFNSMRTIKSLVLSEIPISDITSLISVSKSIGPGEIRRLAQKYLNRNDFWEVLVGHSTT